MNILMIVLRIIHFIFGAVWVGGSILMVTAISPTAVQLGEDAKSFMQHFTLKSKFAPLMFSASTLTVLSGLWMYTENFGFEINMTTGSALALSLGGLGGLAGWLGAFLYIIQSLNGIKAVAGEIAAAGGPPKPEQLEKIAGLQGKIAAASPIITVLLVLTLALMSMGEYFAL